MSYEGFYSNSEPISSGAVSGLGYERAVGVASKRSGAQHDDSEAPERSDGFRTRVIAPTAPKNSSKTAKRRTRKIMNLNRALLRNEINENGNQDGRAKCGRAPIASASKVLVKRHSYGGVFTSQTQTCGSVWACPACLAKIKRVRAELVNDMVQAHLANGGGFALLTLTVPHRDRNELSELLSALSESFDKGIKAGRPWQRLKAKYGLEYVRVLEFTYSQKHGYHPHYHVLLLTKEPLNPHVHTEQWQELETYFKQKWALWVKKKLNRTSHKIHGLDLRPVYGLQCIADYISSISKEMARSDFKKAADGSMSMMDVAECAADGEPWALSIWSEFLKVSKGLRFMTFSQGTVKRLLESDDRADQTDEEIAARQEFGKTEGAVTFRTWKLLHLVSDGVADFLDCWQRSGMESAIDLLRNGTGLEPTITIEHGITVIDTPETSPHMERLHNGELVRIAK